MLKDYVKAMGINRIRLEFKESFESQIKTFSNRINRIRLEFKGISSALYLFGGL